MIAMAACESTGPVVDASIGGSSDSGKGPGDIASAPKDAGTDAPGPFDSGADVAKPQDGSGEPVGSDDAAGDTGVPRDAVGDSGAPGDVIVDVGAPDDTGGGSGGPGDVSGDSVAPDDTATGGDATDGGPCVPDCTAADCGPDGCGGSCGACDDGDPCTTDQCAGGACSHQAVGCDDGDPCTTDQCAGGACSHQVVSCDDGDPCTADQCAGGACGFQPVSCDDGDPCTIDSCKPGAGCASVAAPGCPACSGAGDCGPATQCQAGWCVASTPKVVSVDPASGALIGLTAKVSIRFDLPMDPSSLSVQGPGTSAAWSSTLVATDTVTLSPAVAWGGGPLVLTINAKSVAGQAAPALLLAYTVDAAPPSGRSLPRSGWAAMPESEVWVLFDEPMDPGSLDLGGDLAPLSGIVEWHSVASAGHDALRIVPKPGSEGSGSQGVAGWTLPGTLTIAAADLAGNPASPLVVELVPVPGGWPTLVAPIHAVKTADNDGSHESPITASQVGAWVAFTNETYAPAGIRFAFDPHEAGKDWSFVENTLVNWANAGEPGWPEQEVAVTAEAAKHPGKVTVVFRWGASPPIWPGAFSAPYWNFVVMSGYGNSYDCGGFAERALGHELGHHLGLGHTHSNDYATVEEAEAAFVANGMDETFFDGDSMWLTLPDPWVKAVACDPTVTSLTLAGVTFKLPRNNVMSYYTKGDQLEADQRVITRQVLLLRQAKSLALLLPGEWADPLEAEALPHTAANPGSTAVLGMGPYFGRWSGNEVLHWEASAGGFASGGSSITVTFPAPAPGVRRVVVSPLREPDSGVYSFYVNGVYTGVTLDNWARWGRTMGTPLDLGQHLLFAAGNTLQVKYDKAYGVPAYFGIDYILVSGEPGDIMCADIADCATACLGTGDAACMSACGSDAPPQAAAAFDALSSCIVGLCGLLPSLGCAAGAITDSCAAPYAKCLSCTPDCSGAVCGDDGCYGSCGSCAAGQSCQAGKCVSPKACGQVLDCALKCTPIGEPKCTDSCRASGSSDAKTAFDKLTACLVSACGATPTPACVQGATGGPCASTYSACVSQ
ncbi:MAG: hypothetical protein AMXMBFR64_11820 [Myxococcales bacterium]